MSADMMAAMPADAMGGMSADMMASMPADAMGGMSADMMAAAPPGVMDAAPADAAGLQTEAGGPGLTEAAANDPNFVAPTMDGGMDALGAAFGAQGVETMAAPDPTGENPPPGMDMATSGPAGAPPVGDSMDSALGAAMDANEIGGGSVADAAVPDAGAPADAGIADVQEQVVEDAPPAPDVDPII
jgi:hypothetical protein